MNIDKLPSGNYRIRKTINKKTVTVTVDHYPTEKEIVRLIAEKMCDAKQYFPSMPFNRACMAYIESRDKVISPSTKNGYNSIIRQLSERFGNTPINSISTAMLQTEINRYAAEHSPKSTANFAGFVVSVLNFYDHPTGRITLPQKEKKKPYIPTPEEVRAIIDAVRGSKYEIPLLLACHGLRRSEITALQEGDLDGVRLTINKAKVQDEHGNWVIKSTKTTDSTRTITLDDYTATLIKERGFYDGHPELIYRKLTEVQEQLGIQHFSLHKLRHFHASYMAHLGHTSKQVQANDGWKTDRVLKEVYEHEMDMENAQSKMASEIGGLLAP